MNFLERMQAGFAGRAAGALASLLYPPSCENCGCAVAGGEYLCGACAAGAERLEAPMCGVCSEPFYGALDAPFTCANCHDRNFHFTCAVSAYRSRGVVREMIHRFKYNGVFQLRFPLARWAGEGLADSRLRTDPIDALVPVPLFRTRERQREFNQAAVIGRLVAETGSLAYSDCLLRVRNTTTQTRLDRKARMENLRNAFAMRQNACVRGKNLVLVDDVMTTGSTLDECARTLLRAGAASVRALTVARG